MPRYVAFLRAINLGATRTFPKAAIIAATEATGATEVATHATSGNVVLTCPQRSAKSVAAALEKSYAAAAGFAVPTVVLTLAELREVVATGQELAEKHQPAGKHYVTLYAAPPPAAAAAAVTSLEIPGDVCVVSGRAAYALLEGNIHTSKLLSSKEFAALGEGTSRTIEMLTTLAGKWAAD
ncbi:MAG: DUF1697 domain-containing protein [Tetrasphaera sp.]